MIWLGWDTDKTDIDLHVREPDNTEVYYGNRRSRTGGNLSRDFRQGYGPEVYIIKKAQPGEYKGLTNFYGSHQDSKLTGSTSAVVWVLHKKPVSTISSDSSDCASTTAAGSSVDEERFGRSYVREVQFNTVRLTRNKQREEVVAVVHPQIGCGGKSGGKVVECRDIFAGEVADSKANSKGLGDFLLRQN